MRGCSTPASHLQRRRDAELRDVNHDIRSLKHGARAWGDKCTGFHAWSLQTKVERVPPDRAGSATRGGNGKFQKAGHKARRLCRHVAAGELSAQCNGSRLRAAKMAADINDRGPYATRGDFTGQLRDDIVGSIGD